MDDENIFSINISIDSEEMLGIPSDSSDFDWLTTSESSSFHSENSYPPLVNLFSFGSNLSRSRDSSLSSIPTLGDSDESMFETSVSKPLGVRMSKEEIKQYTIAYTYEGETMISCTDTNSTIVDNCSICISSFYHEEAVRRLPCFHLFHVDCIDTWFEKSTLCPNCNTDVIKGVA